MHQRIWSVAQQKQIRIGTCLKQLEQLWRHKDGFYFF